MLHKFLHSKLGKVDFSRLLQKIDKYADFNNNGQVRKFLCMMVLNFCYRYFAFTFKQDETLCGIYLRYERLLGNIACNISEELYGSF